VRWVVLLLGCAAYDPCAAFDGQACVAIEVRGAMLLDQLRVQSAELGIDAFSPERPLDHQVTTPVEFAFLPGGTHSPFHLVVSGLDKGVTLGRGTATLSTQPGQHQRTVLLLEPLDDGVDLAGVDLAGVDVAGADPAAVDLRSVDLSSSSPDLACGGTGDEDHDGIVNTCDLCPIDPSPLDSDGDGVGDVCDPDVNKPGNRILMFDGFDVDDKGRWEFGTVFGGARTLGGSSQAEVTDLEDVLADQFRVEVRFAILSPFFDESHAGIFVSNAAGSGGTGIKCLVRHSKSAGIDTVDNDLFMNGASVDTSQQFCRFSSTDETVLRLTRRGDRWLCEAKVGNDTIVAVSKTFAGVAPKLQLETLGLTANFEYALIESTVP
jgi:hypothetical protein